MEQLETALGYRFRTPSLLTTALTHSSYANEKRAGKKNGQFQSNERLEFLGDAILNAVAADYIYRTFPQMPEGNLTRLRAAVVCEEALHREARVLGLPSLLLLGHGEELSSGRERPSILADATEAVIGALYLDGGLEAARAFIHGFLKESVADAASCAMHRDYKTALQEIVQKNREETLAYRLADASGPDHEKSFTVELLLNSNVFARGIGHTKKAAEQNAARAALALMGEGV